MNFKMFERIGRHSEQIKIQLLLLLSSYELESEGNYIRL